MCRLFGFRSVIQSQVHSSLISADNALSVQSGKHPDGWGVAYYIHGAPHLIKSANSALNCNIFQKISGVVSSNTVLAHIRKATLGQQTILNTHPFQYGNWVFAHNGNIKDFEKHKPAILSKISPCFKRFILGSTDSELIFYFLLSFIEKNVELIAPKAELKPIVQAIQEALQELIKITGQYADNDNAGETETYYSFLITNGHSMIAHHGGKNLFYSTYKKRCNGRDQCPSYSPECEAATQTGSINHLLFSSEPLSGENIWLPMTPGQIVAADSNMKLHLFDSK